MLERDYVWRLHCSAARRTYGCANRCAKFRIYSLIASNANGQAGVRNDGILKPNCRMNLPFGISVILTLLVFFSSAVLIMVTGNCSVIGCENIDLIERDKNQSAGFSKRKNHHGTQDSTIKSRPPGFNTLHASFMARWAFSQLDRQSALVRWWINITINTTSNRSSRSGKASQLP